ncbi:unnamed protein product [Lactuca virosa]|uniref:Cucumisin n=1 Tax=Lactuca virosa TaxID=75947 RepID=A0AAU9N7R9_9ASTR|nr:unnamed protein product [Lactuca virosa]
MGFPTTIERSPVGESNTIIGVIDSGIWPESESFSDEGLGPIPEKWKGECRGGTDFTCNRKIIGARSYIMGDSVRDTKGHGTHVSSIVAGNQVYEASYYGIAEGIARGGVPSARLAVYKVCDEVSCEVRDIMKAFDDAISDGVDIISISIGQDVPTRITSDPIAIGAFHAIQKGILTVQAAGNAGPRLFSVTGVAPWIFSVAASNTDRRIINKLLLGDGSILEGASINAFPSSQEEVPLVYGRQVTSTCSENEARYCLPRCIDNSLVEQKVVMCDKNNHVDSLKVAGAIGCIIPNNENNFSDIGPLPIGALNKNDMNLVKTYQNNTKKPKVRISKSEAINNPASPLVASFSSRGPSKFIYDIIKPDVTAPGVEILAAFSPMASPSDSFIDKSSVNYTIRSGTSMACLHVAAAAAFVMSFHPNWSPSAVKSALMTTAWEMDPIQNLDAEFAYGSGHIDPQKAKDPGLVYDISEEDYQMIWCNIAHSVNASCRANFPLTQLNYPSMVARVDVKSAFVLSFPRTVTNVGDANSKYVASIQGDSKLNIRVDPNILQFTSLNQTMFFVVTVEGKGIKSPLTIKSGSLLWTSDKHKVRSPVVVYTGSATTSSGGVSTPSTFCKTYVILFVCIIIAHCI